MADCNLSSLEIARSQTAPPQAGLVLSSRSLRNFLDCLPWILDLSALFIARSLLFETSAQPANGQPLIILLAVCGVLYCCGAYRSGENRRPEKELERICKAFAIAFITPYLMSVSLPEGSFPSFYQTELWLATSLVLVLGERKILRVVRSRMWRAGWARRKIILLGSPAEISNFKRHLAVQRYRENEIVAELALDSDERAVTASEVTGCSEQQVEQLREALCRVRAHAVIIVGTHQHSLGSHFHDFAQCLSKTGTEFEFRSPLPQSTGFEFEFDTCCGCLRLRRRLRFCLLIQLAVKAALDVPIGLVGSVLALLMAAPIWLLLKLEDGGSLFHHREYVGCDGKTYYYLKFRTMIENADRELRKNPELQMQFDRNYKLKNDPRILKVGRIMRKFSIDEFPQFFSVLLGRLTFVGPRVISRDEIARQGSTVAKRFSFKPGMTGYWQVMGRQTTDYEERILMDMFYIDHWSIWLDIVIISKTIVKFFAPEGAY